MSKCRPLSDVCGRSCRPFPPPSATALEFVVNYCRYNSPKRPRIRKSNAQTWQNGRLPGVPPERKAPPPVTDEIQERLRKDLAEAIAKTKPDPSVQIEAEILYGHPAQVLIDESRDRSLLVVGHRGHGGFTEMLTGSVSIHCVNHAACPVVVVRGG